MNESRLKMLLSYLREEPDDPFTLYALALEYLPEKPEKSEEIFNKLLQKHPEYLATYLQAGNYYRSKKEFDRSKEIYFSGITLAEKVRDSLALRELKNALEDLLFDEED